MSAAEPEVRFTFESSDVIWRSESGAPPPAQLARVDDKLTADAALRRVRRGEHLVYEGDFHNAKQLLGAMARRLGKRDERAHRSPLETFRAEREARQLEHETLSRIVVVLDPAYRLSLRRAPDVCLACAPVWGAATMPTVVPLKTLLGMLGAAEWQRKGLDVPGLAGRLYPHYGVFLPTRSEYLELLLQAPRPEGKRVFDVGTGTGVLSFVLLQRGAASAIGTDIDPRSVECARDNALRLGLARRFEAQERSLFPEGAAELVISNPPWIPEPPKNRVDRAVFDPDSAFLDGFLSGLPAHLPPGGEGWLLLSNLAELLGLRSPGFLSERLARSALEVKWTRSTAARHPKAHDRQDALHAARSAEVTTLYCLAPATPPGRKSPT
ncbi:MAG: 50S ribosomal protein L11 methyltransferase [Myxococcaceae bacterium]